MDAISKLKADLLSELNVQYKNLIAFIQNAPLNQQFKGYAYQNLDQGVMWLQKAIEFLQADAKQEETQPSCSEAIQDGLVEEKIPETLN